MDKESVHPDSDSEDFKPLKKKTLNKTDSSKRFKTVPTEDEVSSVTKGYVPDNTKQNISLSVKVFNEWRYAREGEKKCPENYSSYQLRRIRNTGCLPY